jgi:hypothetical protein
LLLRASALVVSLPVRLVVARHACRTGRDLLKSYEMSCCWRGTTGDENLCAGRLSSVLLGAGVPDYEIDAGGRPGTAICCFEHALQVR